MTETVHRWVFDDPYTGDTWTVPINPNAMTSITGPKNISNQTTMARTGKAVLWEGAQKPFDWSFSGVILEEDHLTNLTLWCNKGNRVYITDHYLRQFEVYLMQLDAVPKRSVQRPWRHDYTVKALMLRRIS